MRRIREFASRLVLLGVVLGSSTAESLHGQRLAPGDPMAEYLRILQLIGRAEPGSLTAGRPELGSSHLVGPGPHPWAGRFEPRTPRSRSLQAGPGTAALRVHANTSFPVGQNDGAVWQGKGLTTALDVGGRAAWRALTLSIHPTLIHTQNASFELAPVISPGMPAFGYPWRRIDLPQRFGPHAYWTLDPGESEVRVSAYGATAAFGTASLWWGPGQRNAIAMSNNAPGFPHASLGTDGPVGIGIGDLEVEWIWGDLAHSDWFDPTLDDTDRYLTGIVVAFSPTFLDGLTVGATRVFYAWKPSGGLTISDYFVVLQGVRKEAFSTPQNPSGNDEHDQLLSFFGRWVFGASGAEVYAEWSRNDHSWNFRDFFLEPEHSQGYTLGLQKVVELSGSRLLALKGELTHLERSTTRELRASPTYYEHSIVAQGYTQRGQVIGASIGPGGNTQHLGIDLYAPWGRAGAFLQRDVRDNDAFYRWAALNGGSFWDHDVMLHSGVQGLAFVGDLEVGGGLILTRELNRNFYGRDLWNLNLSLSARWRPR